MNYTFQRVASYCGLRLSYYITAALLAISYVGLALTENNRTASPIYILLALALLPAIMKSMFFSSSKETKRENNLAFPLFCKKYHYDLIAYKSMNLSYFLLFILFAAWQISYSFSETVTVFISFLPSLIAITSLLSRILAVIAYRLYFHFFPLKAMR